MVAVVKWTAEPTALLPLKPPPLSSISPWEQHSIQPLPFTGCHQDNCPLGILYSELAIKQTELVGKTNEGHLLLL